MSVEQSIIGHVLRNGDDAFAFLIEHGITVEFFHSRSSASAFAWILDEWSKYGGVPSEEKFARRHPNYAVVIDPEPLGSLCDELRGNHAISVARDIVPSIVSEFETEPHNFDLPAVLGKIGELQERINTIQSVNEVALLSEKMPAYLEALMTMDPNEMPGVPTGISALDSASGGWQPENFGVIGAGPKRFKTAILVWMAISAARAGYDACFITFEMSISEVMQRIFCLGAEVNYTNIQRGSLTDRQKRRLNDFTNEFKSWDGDIELIHDVAAVTSLAGLAARIRTRKNKPDVVFIDGLYQMVDDTQQWDSQAQMLTAVSRGIKRLAAVEGLPIVGTTQALLSRISARKGTEMGSLGYTSAFAQDANVIIGLDRKDMLSNNIILRVVGARSMAGMAVNLTVDLDNGMIIEGGEIHDGDIDTEY